MPNEGKSPVLTAHPIVGMRRATRVAKIGSADDGRPGARRRFDAAAGMRASNATEANSDEENRSHHQALQA